MKNNTGCSNSTGFTDVKCSDDFTNPLKGIKFKLSNGVTKEMFTEYHAEPIPVIIVLSDGQEVEGLAKHSLPPIAGEPYKPSFEISFKEFSQVPDELWDHK